MSKLLEFKMLNGAPVVLRADCIVACKSDEGRVRGERVPITLVSVLGMDGHVALPYPLASVRRKWMDGIARRSAGTRRRHKVSTGARE